MIGFARKNTNGPIWGLTRPRPYSTHGNDDTHVIVKVLFSANVSMVIEFSVEEKKKKLFKTREVQIAEEKISKQLFRSATWRYSNKLTNGFLLNNSMYYLSRLFNISHWLMIQMYTQMCMWVRSNRQSILGVIFDTSWNHKYYLVIFSGIDTLGWILTYKNARSLQDIL